MDPKQKPIADWMNRTIMDRKISARAWAELAGLGKDTVSRALRDNYQNVTTTRTIAKLADAIGVEMPGGVSVALPSTEAIGEVLKLFLTAVAPDRSPAPEVLRGLSEALRDWLVSLADEPSAATDPDISRALARAPARRLQRIAA